MPETITKGKEEDDDEESGSDVKRSGSHTHWVEHEMEAIRAERWHRKRLDNVDQGKKKEDMLTQEVKVDKEMRKQQKSYV